MSTGIKGFQKTLASFLEDQLQKEKPVPVAWHCAYCSGNHSGDLLKKVTAVHIGTVPEEVELLNAGGEAFKVIGISKNKKMNEGKIAYYREKGIIYIEVSAVTEDGKTIADQLAHPKFLGTCLNPKCKTCGSFLRGKNMVIVDSSCWKCDSKMKVAVLEKSHYYPGPDEFSDAELEIARNKNVYIKSNFSKTVGSAYLSNTCPHCDAMIGNHYLFTDHYTSAIYGYYDYERVPLGFYCERCEENTLERE